MLGSVTASTVDRSELIWLTAGELHRRIRNGEVSARDVVDAHIARIDDVNPRLNALVVKLFDEARAAAEAADQRRERGEPLGPLHGVPITIKEQFLVAGTPTTFGLTDQRYHRALHDGPLVRRLRDAGAIILGKSNVSQLLFYHESDNPLYGRTNNPWNLERTPGGSSGGEAALVAAGCSAFGLTSDMGGSTRVPAHFSGVFGLKPTTGRLTTLDTRPGYFASGQEAIQPQPGVVARSTDDLALAFGVLAAPGLEALDARVQPVPWRDPAAVAVAGLRVAAYSDDGYFSASPAIRRAVDVASAALRDRGATVEPWTPPDVPSAVQLLFGIVGADGGRWARRAVEASERDPRIASLTRLAGLRPSTRAALSGVLVAARQGRLASTLRSTGSRPAAEYWELVEARNRYRSAFIERLDAGRFDAIICPPHALPALTHGASKYLLTAASYALLFNLLGMPAGVAPVTRVMPGEESDRRRSLDIVDRAARDVERHSTGLPVGVQVVARLWREDLVLAIMAAIEAAVRPRPDFPLRPPL